MNGASTPADACVAPIPTARSSTISTEAPRRTSSYAIAQPTTPAPTTIMSDGPLTVSKLSVFSSLPLLRRRAPSRRRRAARVQIVPVHDGVETERIGALRLPPPERTDREH